MPRKKKKKKRKILRAHFFFVAAIPLWLTHTVEQQQERHNSAQRGKSKRFKGERITESATTPNVYYGRRWTASCNWTIAGRSPIAAAAAQRNKTGKSTDNNKKEEKDLWASPTSFTQAHLIRYNSAADEPHGRAQRGCGSTSFLLTSAKENAGGGKTCGLNYFWFPITWKIVIP